MDEAILKAREKWRICIEGDGTHCPVCDRWGRIYGRNINRTMAYSLLWLLSASSDEENWVDVPNTAPRSIVRSNQLPTLRWWGLVERLDSDDPTFKHSGMWKVSQKGIDFAHSRIRVPHKVFTYNGEVEAFSMNEVFISECFQDNFDYQEVMNSFFPPAQHKLF
jgi:hypothetical protein